MKSGHFLRCVDCEALFRPSAHDRTAEFRMTADGFTEVVRDDCMAFLTSHARHRLETLRPVKAQAFHAGALWDAAAPTYWEVSNGSETAVVEGRRAHLGAPLRYRLRPGHVVAERLSVEIPLDDLRQQVDRALFPGVAPERKLAAFIDGFKTVVWDLDPASLTVMYDVPGDPTLAVAKLPPSALARVCANARRIFDAAESTKIEQSLMDTEDPDGFTVLVRQRVHVEG